MDLNYSPCVAVFPIDFTDFPYSPVYNDYAVIITVSMCRYYVTLIYVLAKSQDRNLLKVNNYPLLILRCTFRQRKLSNYKSQTLLIQFLKIHIN